MGCRIKTAISLIESKEFFKISVESFWKDFTKFFDEMKRFVTPNHQNLLENLRNTEVSFY